MRRWFGVTGMSAALFVGVVGGVALATLSTPLPAFSFDQVSIISWRGGGDAVPASATTTGWSAPMFYATPAEGAGPEPPAGTRPTGVWAPGDGVQRSLIIKNVDPDYLVRVSQLQIQLRGDLDLTPLMRISVSNEAGSLLHEGSLAEFVGGQPLSFSQPLVLLRGGQQELTFTVSLNRDADNRYQGKSVQADVVIGASQFAYPMIIDVHPNSWPNPINPRSRGNIPVAVNGSALLDVTTLTPESARFGPGQATPLRHSYEDWNRDGFPDLMLKFDNRDSAFTCGMTVATLTIAAHSGEVYEGSDPIKTPGCR